MAAVEVEVEVVVVVAPVVAVAAAVDPSVVSAPCRSVDW